MKKHMRIRLSVLLVCILLLTGCEAETSAPQPSGSVSPSGKPAAGNVLLATTSEKKTGIVSAKETLVWRLSGDPGTLDIAKSSSNLNAYNLISICSSPLIKEYDLKGDGTQTGYTCDDTSLCESFAWDSDYLGITFKLRKGVKFHNGDEVKAGDVAFSIGRYAGKTRWASVDFDKTALIDDYTVHVSLKYPDATIMLSFAKMRTVCEKALKACANEAEYFTTAKFVGSGPYRVKKWIAGDRIEFEAFEDYFEGAPFIKHVVARFISEASVATMELETGGVDLIEAPNYSDFVNVVNSPGAGRAAAWKSPSDMMALLGFNCAGRFSDLRLRQAVAYAINKEEMSLGGYNGNGYNHNGYLSASLDFIIDQKENYLYKQNIEKAKALLAAAGYPNGLDMIIIFNGDTEQALALQIMANQLKAVNINLALQAYDGATYNDIMTNTTTGWDMWYRVWGGSGNPGSTLITIADEKCHAVGNAAGGEAMVALGKALTQEMDPVKQEQISREIQEKFWSEWLFWIPHHQKIQTVLANPKLKNASRFGNIWDFRYAYFEK